MDAFSVLENSYYMINKNFGFYKKNFSHTYYLDVKDDETKFIDKMFRNTENILSAQDKMLNYSIAAIYTAMAVLLEIMCRNGIKYTKLQIEKICKGFSSMQKDEISLVDKSEEELDEILFGLLTDGIDLGSRKKSGSERTPKEIIKYMLDIIGYNENTSIYNSIIDPACGTGTFVKQILDRLIAGLYKNKNINMIKEKLIKEKLICAYDTKPLNVYVTKIVMISTLIKNNLISTMENIIEMMDKLPIYCNDFLRIERKTDFVIGNPPYIRLQNMPIEYREFMKKNFVSATGRFDIFTCFIEKGDSILNEKGKMCLITSNKYLTANYGVGIRKYLSSKGHVRKLIDLYDTKFFSASVLPAIIMCENSNLKDYDVDYTGMKLSVQKPQYHCLDMNKLFWYIENEMKCNKSIVHYGNSDTNILEISHSKIKIPLNGTTWNFSSSDENSIKLKMDKQKICSLKDIMNICVGIKTTADSVFVKPMTEKFIQERGFEKNVIYSLIQSFDVNKWSITWGQNVRDRYILYPHQEVDGNMVAIPLEEIPRTKQYLEECANILKNRLYLRKSKNRMWYECWVPQTLSKFKKTKIVTKDIVSNNTFALDESGKLCQGNTFFLTRKDSVFSTEYIQLNEHQYYCFILGILNSKAMEYYQKMISGCLYSQKYRYTTSNLNRWPMPKIDKDDAMKISEYVDKLISGTKHRSELENRIDEIIYDRFKLNKEDIVKIEKFIGRKGREEC